MELRHSIAKLLRKSLPPQVLLLAMTQLLPLFDRRRRGHNCRFETIDSRTFRVLDKQGTSLYFYEPLRAVRYLHPGGVEGLVSKIFRRYQSKGVCVEPGDVVIDIGANIGEFTLAASKMSSRVIAIEPDPSAFECLTRNTASLANTTAVNRLVGEFAQMQTFYCSPATADSSMIPPTTFDRALEIQSQPLDAIVDSCGGLDSIDFLKVEAEGAEPEVLRGAASMLHKIRKISVDAGPERYGQTTISEVISILQHHGFICDTTANQVFAIRSNCR